MMKRLMSYYRQARKFLLKDLWDLSLKESSKARARTVWSLRVIMLAISGFREDRCTMRASALTFVTLLGLVPILATMLAVAGAFELGVHLEARADDAINALDAGSLQTQLMGVKDTVFQVLHEARPSIMGGVGVVLLLYTVIKMLGTIENSFNAVWGVWRARPFLRKVADYISTIVVLSVLMAAPALVRGFMSSNAALLYLTETIGEHARVTIVLSNVGAFLAPCVAFMLVNKFIPNTKVHWGAAIAGGFFGGIVWNLSIKLFVGLGIGVAKYNQLYGTLAFLPFCLVWLQLNWLIVLMSVELTYAIQNEHSYVRSGAYAETTHAAREGMALAVMAPIAMHFHNGLHRWTPDALSDHLDAPLRMVNEVMELLCAEKILVTTSGEHPAYVPGRSLETIPLADILDAVGHYSSHPHAFGPIHKRAIAIQHRVRAAGHGEVRTMTALDLAEIATEDSPPTAEAAGTETARDDA